MKLVALLIIAVPAFAETPVVDFDQGVDAAAVVQEAQKNAVEAAGVEAENAVKVAYRAERDCVTFVFEPDGPTTSETVWLRSTEYWERCENYGPPPYGPGRICREEPRWTHREKVWVTLQDRKELYPWEREAFDVCLEGNWLSAHTIQAAHKYTGDRVGEHFTLIAGERIPMRPDKGGLQVAGLRSSGVSIAVGFADKWASYYTGEQVVIKAALKREIDNWFDSTLIEKEFTMPVAENYAVNFDEFVADFSEQMKPGKKYYVKWGFKRIGKISTDKYIKRGDSNTAVYAPRLSAFAR